MQCQCCDQPATLHVTDMVKGETVEYHVCETHFNQIDGLEPAKLPAGAAHGLIEFCSDPKLGEALFDPAARQQTAAHLLPALCLALLDAKPEVKIIAAYRLMFLGPDARSALAALRDAQRDPDSRVQKAATLAAAFIESDQQPRWLF